MSFLVDKRSTKFYRTKILQVVRSNIFIYLYVHGKSNKSHDNSLDSGNHMIARIIICRMRTCKYKNIVTSFTVDVVCFGYFAFKYLH